MKKIVYIFILLILFSCSSNNKIEKEKIKQDTWSILDIKTDEQNIIEVKELLEDNAPSTIKSVKNENTESWVLSDKELEIIENTSSWEIDNLIDILFQDLN